ncbi:MAG: OmpA family protein [Chitinophagaceae bacterium]|nr:OmpA family protein [Chitinophagaceae bacterium]
MLKPLHLLAACCCALVSHAQRTDTLALFYHPDHFTLTKPAQQKLDSFLHQGWDRIDIFGYTDETEGEEYNLELSKKRSGEVYKYLLSKNIPAAAVSSRYFGESMPKADNASDDGRALNRRTEIVGYRFARIQVKPTEDPMKPVTQTLDNGFIITYQPGALSNEMSGNFAAGSGMNFQLITNTMQMRQLNLFNNTTNGEILSSVLIICGDKLDPCKLDKPVFINVPVPYQTKCPITKVKFFNAVMENGVRIWKEETKLLSHEMIGGKEYVGVWIDDFCQCINFDFKIDKECFDTDSIQVQYVNAGIKNLSAELRGLNSVYLPRMVDDSLVNIVHLKNEMDEALISFSLYNGKRRVRTFRNESLKAFPYDAATNRYLLSTSTSKFYFPGVKIYDVVLKVNKDKYRVYADKNRYEFMYLNRSEENIVVDFAVLGPKGKLTQYKNQPLASLPFDAGTGYYIIDKKFLKALKLNSAIASR